MFLFSNVACKVMNKKTPMSKVTNQPDFKKVKTSAERRGDWVLIGRLADVDLVAVGAQYHRKCYQTYVSERNITSHISDKQQTVDDPYQEAFTKLISKIDDRLFHHGAVYELPKLLTKYKQYLADYGANSPDYRSHRLK